LNGNQHHFLNPKQNDRVVIGDELLVQVTKEAIKSKAPMAGSELHLTGGLVVVTLGGSKVGVSKKLPNDSKTQTMKQALQERLPKGYGAILRTNSYESTLEQVEAEFDRLLEQLSTLVEQARFHKVYSCLYQERSAIQQLLDDYNNDRLITILTDIPELEAQLQKLLTGQDIHKLKHYSETMQPMYALYRLDRDWKEAVAKRVWLKSGAYLVIEQTEAMVVIDVNTGKAVNKKNRAEHFLKVNQEAAGEIARQLRLRNLSGIIMIDFIDMEDLTHKEQLIQYLCNELKKDRIQTTYIDMTRLNLVELTRKKVKRSLQEQLQQ
jgi:ribonuclease G